MAIETYTFCISRGGNVVINYDVNTANWTVRKIRCINNSSRPVYIRILARNPDTGIASIFYEVTAPAFITTEENIAGVSLGWDSVDGGIIMGVYEFHMRC